MLGGSQGLPSAKTDAGAAARKSTTTNHNNVFFTVSSLVGIETYTVIVCCQQPARTPYVGNLEFLKT
jgi:hypothetical protein